jgi:hypothetical protein
MSDPFTMFLIQAGMSAATTGIGVASAAGAASAQSDANAIGKRNAMTARDANFDQINLAGQQQQASAEQQIEANQIEALKATSTATVAAGEAGVTGLSVNALLADMWGKNARFVDNVNQNLEGVQQQSSFDMGNAARGYQATVNNMPIPQKPDYLGAGLQAGSGMFGAYKDHLRIKPSDV